MQFISASSALTHLDEQVSKVETIAPFSAEEIVDVRILRNFLASFSATPNDRDSVESNSMSLAGHALLALPKISTSASHQYGRLLLLSTVYCLVPALLTPEEAEETPFSLLQKLLPQVFEQLKNHLGVSSLNELVSKNRRRKIFTLIAFNCYPHDKLRQVRQDEALPSVL